MLAPAEPKVFAQETEFIRVADRCDRCGARAYALAVIGPGEGGWLLFCGHHFARHEVALRAIARVVVDERHRILGERKP